MHNPEKDIEYTYLSATDAAGGILAETIVGALLTAIAVVKIYSAYAEWLSVAVQLI